MALWAQNLIAKIVFTNLLKLPQMESKKVAEQLRSREIK